MSLEQARGLAAELQRSLSSLVDEFATYQSPSWDDQGDLEQPVSDAAPTFEALAAAIVDLFEGELEQLSNGAELDEVLSLMARHLGDKRIIVESRALAAGRFLHFIKLYSYGEFSDPDPQGNAPDIEGDFTLLDAAVDAVLDAAENRDEGEGRR